ncbi:MFS transporter [Virgisporangium aliadipatigenens]|uniref:MFS transporter n=1 Tax=Virgisporangium aliadipatigenens TaxID=741659 RepID=A0A8J3YF20_9ACTN|nr:MFS transporter [Virgisporangium aliadipatigenens]GIJ43964.1 MFS transporter [Virgisporangium aliadipatigenens]
MAARDQQARIAVGAAYAAQGFSFAALLTQTNVLKDRFGFTDGELSLVLLAVPLVAGIGSIVAGALAPRLGSAPVLRVGGPLVCAALVAVGAASSVPALAAALVLLGLGLGIVDATMNMQGVAVERRYGRPLLSSFHGWWSLGAVAGALTTAATAKAGLTVLESLTAAALVGLVLTLAAGPRELRRAEETALAPSTVDAAAVAAIPWRPVALIGTAVMLMYVADSATSNWSAVFLDDVLESSRSVAALGVFAYQCATMLGRAAADRLVRQYGPAVVTRAGAAIGGVGLLVVAAAPDSGVALAGFALQGLGLCVVVPLSFSAAGRLDPAHTGVAVARVNLFNYAGFVVGAGLIGVVAEAADLRWAFVVPAVLAFGVIGLAGSFAVRAPDRTPTGSPTRVV